MKLQKMSIRALEDYNQQLTEERISIKQEQREVAQRLDQLRAEQQLKDDIAALQNKHGVTVVVPQGVEAKD